MKIKDLPKWLIELCLIITLGRVILLWELEMLKKTIKKQKTLVTPAEPAEYNGN